MNSIVLDRIHSQKKPVMYNPVSVLSFPVNMIQLSEPISLSDLRTILLEIFVDANIQNEPRRTLEFAHICPFIDWYFPKQSEFSPEQNQALATLIEARDFIFAGCDCKRDVRERSSMEYFRRFWAENLKTDLPIKVLQVGKAHKLVIAGVGEYPPLTP